MLHDRLSDYLNNVEIAVRSLENCHIEKYEEEILSNNRVNLRIRIRFIKGQLLEINEAVIIVKNNFQHLAYRYHFQEKSNLLIFRFDNAPHFPHIKTFPHHKHLPNSVEASIRPSIAEVINQVKNYVE